MGSKCVNRKERIPADGQSRQGKKFEVDLRSAEALVALEALFLLPEHHEKIPSERVAASVLQGLPILRISRVLYHSGLPLVQPTLAVAEISLDVRI